MKKLFKSSVVLAVLAVQIAPAFANGGQYGSEAAAHRPTHGGFANTYSRA